jgi:tRNA A37 threonylcarbamoyladenosine synthetase subunit TsaC/SUA5/YrdC
VRVTNRYWEILREGAISEAELARVIGDHPLRKGC